MINDNNPSRLSSNNSYLKYDGYRQIDNYIKIHEQLVNLFVLNHRVIKSVIIVSHNLDLQIRVHNNS